MNYPRSTRALPRTLALSSITLAILALSQQAAAQQSDAPMQRVEVTGSSIKRLAAEEALPVTIIKAEELEKQGLTTLADVMMALPQSVSLQPSNAGSGTNINLRGLGVNRTLVLLNGRRLATARPRSTARTPSAAWSTSSPSARCKAARSPCRRCSRRATAVATSSASP